MQLSFFLVIRSGITSFVMVIKFYLFSCWICEVKVCNNCEFLVVSEFQLDVISFKENMIAKMSNWSVWICFRWDILFQWYAFFYFELWHSYVCLPTGYYTYMYSALRLGCNSFRHSHWLLILIRSWHWVFSYIAANLQCYFTVSFDQDFDSSYCLRMLSC